MRAAANAARGDFFMRLLVVEDDPSMQKSICKGLTKLGYAVDAASDGEEALELFDVNEYDAVILDLNLPKVDGMSVLKNIRETDKESAVLILSARRELDDKILGLDTGANDYLVKPFFFSELEARLRALLRRRFTQADTVIKCGGLDVDTAKKTAFVKGVKIDLTRKEYAMLEYLLFHRDRIISAEELIEHVWDNEVDLFTNSFKVQINSLKKKLAAQLGDGVLIKNTRGVGYYIVEADHEKE